MECNVPKALMLLRESKDGFGNACGAFGLTLDKTHPFTAACNFHDMCYARCTDPSLNGGKMLTQKDCDDMFLRLMLEIVDNVGKPEEYSVGQADEFYQAVRTLGSAAFKASVNGWCTCSATKPTAISSSWYKPWGLVDMEQNLKVYHAIGGSKGTIGKLYTDIGFFQGYLKDNAKYACSRNTGGTCSWWGCDTSRNAYCDEFWWNECMCTSHQCAVNGACVDIK